jgi:hypothetical protein
MKPIKIDTGEIVCYDDLHRKLRRENGNAKHCSFCSGVGAKRFEWALLKGKKYSRDIKNYIPLCPSCHRLYDYKEEQGINHSKKMKGRPAHNKGKDSRLELICLHCRDDFRTYNSKSKFCSNKCSAIHRENKRKNK